jgi:cysteinyl-tRNA synthetase
LRVQERILKIYNTLTREKEEFTPIEPGKVRMYVCGPTVYDDAHVGHAMSSIVFDVIRRYLEFKGFQVQHVMNYTDVDDKIINRANQLSVDPVELADSYRSQYDQHLDDLNVLPPHMTPRVSQEIDQIIEMVSGLVEKEFAYQLNGDVYFRVGKDEDYGKLSGRDLESLRPGMRLEIDERKEDPADFALWKSAKQGEPAWESPWGSGRPGWHIECSAMSLRHLGEQIDIHGGGNDLVFPHHENEIAQTESLTGKQFARFWIHNGMMQLAGEAMSKSTGNVFTVSEFLSEHEPDVLRMLILNSSYRSPLTFNDAVLKQSERALERLRAALKPAEGLESGSSGESLLADAERSNAAFENSMDDDFNTAGALAVMFDLVRIINTARDQGIEAGAIQAAQKVLHDLAEVLGLRLKSAPQKEGDAAALIELFIELRNTLRDQKHFELADLVRDRLAELGVVLEDGREGTSWTRR